MLQLTEEDLVRVTAETAPRPLNGAAHLSSWAGMCPGNEESDGKRLSGKTRNPGLTARSGSLQFIDTQARLQSGQDHLQAVFEVVKRIAFGQRGGVFQQLRGLIRLLEHPPD
jgi:hypothetical protein